MRPKPLQLSATTTEQIEQVGPGLSSILIKNYGSNNVYIDFDKEVDTNESYLLEAGEIFTLEFNFINLRYQAAAGTSTLHVLKVLQ